MIGTAVLLFVVAVLIGAAFAAIKIDRLKISLKQAERTRSEWAEESYKERDRARALQVELDAWRQKHDNQRVELKRMGDNRLELLAIIQGADQTRAALHAELAEGKGVIARLKRLSEMSTVSCTEDQYRELQRKLTSITAELERLKAKRPKRDQFGKFVKK